MCPLSFDPSLLKSFAARGETFRCIDLARVLPAAMLDRGGELDFFPARAIRSVIESSRELGWLQHGGVLPRMVRRFAAGPDR